MTAANPFRLLARRRFAPFFATQFLGALNDNLFKNALIVLIAFTVAPAQSDLLVNLSAGLFILPFLLFSAQAGQIAERFEKGRLIRCVKLAEVAIMAVAGLGFLADSLPLLLFGLFAMGAQSALFGPVKYAIIPQHLRRHELVAGNALVETGTFLAILAGTIAGGLLIIGQGGALTVSIALLVCAGAGCLAAWAIPAAPAAAPGLRVGWNPLKESVRVVGLARGNAAVFKSILGISWFWCLGAAYLTQLPNYTRLTLGGNVEVITLLLVVFSVGVALGSLLCERLSRGRIELGLVPLGSILLTVFGLDLYFAAPAPWQGGELRDVGTFLADPASWRVLADLGLLGVAGGLYTVPLYAMVQQRTPADRRSRVIAANNILNALFMVAAAGLGVLLLSVLELSVPEMLLVMTALNVGVATYIYLLVPEFLLRFVVWLLTSTIYRVVRRDLTHIPEDGAALLVCNHVSYVDALVLAGSCPRPVRFVMDGRLFRMPGLGWLFRQAGVVPILPRDDDPELYERAFARISSYLRDGELVCIFPEGRLTRDGELDVFKHGVSRILRTDPVPVVPLALRGLWGSRFSHAARTGASRCWRRLRRQVELVAGATLAPHEADPAQLRAAVAGLRGARK